MDRHRHTDAADMPSSELDLYDEHVLLNPYEQYATLRDLGPVVWMQRVGAYAVPGYDEVRGALHDWKSFSSAHGIGLDQAINDLIGTGVFTSDPPEHNAYRNVLQQQLAHRSVSAHRRRLDERADALVTPLLRRGTFDVVGELAQPYASSVLFELLGLPTTDRERILEAAHASFDALGPLDRRCVGSLRHLRSLFTYAGSDAVPGHVDPAGFVMGIYRAADEGRLAHDGCVGLVSAYLWAGMDTAASALGSAIDLFARNPDQWTTVRDDPSLIPNAIEEVVRLESPIQVLARRNERQVSVGGTTLPVGSRVLLLFGSANRDRRRFVDPDVFDVERDTTGHVAFGAGVHRCAGVALARAEVHAVLLALSRRVRRFEVLDRHRAANNVIRGLRSLRVRTVV